MKPTQEEMIFWIDRFRLFFSPYINGQRITGLSEKEADEAHDAIHSLIVEYETLKNKVEEWQRRLRGGYDLLKVGSQEYKILIPQFLEEIRDFGKGK
jgi:hypothetical protein